jgi:pyruvate carboxylase
MCEAAICYTGDMLDLPSRPKVSVEYYLKLAYDLSRGKHISSASCGRAYEAIGRANLFKALREEIAFAPVHFIPRHWVFQQSDSAAAARCWCRRDDAATDSCRETPQPCL